MGKVYLLKNYYFSEKKRGEDLARSSPLLNGCDDCCFCGRFCEASKRQENFKKPVFV